MTTARGAATAVTAVLIAAGLAQRACRHAAAAGFEPGIARRARPTHRLEHVRFGFRADTHEVEVRARSARPGHLSIGYFKLGISTFVALSDAVVRVRSEGGAGLSIKAAEATLEGRALRFEHAVVEGEGDAAAGAGQRIPVSLDLTTGRVTWR